MPILVILLLAVVSAVIFLIFFNRQVIVPSSISQQANFVIFYPQPSQQVTVQIKTFKYDPTNKQVSFIVSFSGRNITFAEQGSPDSFADDPNFYSQFITKLNGYTTFGSVNGTVDLTRPSEVKNETAVMNAKGTLLFANSNGDISEDNWKSLFNVLHYTQPN